MSAEQHDRVFASVSHLPHVLSFALVEQILESPDAALKFSFAAGGFRDFTRIAASSPEMWRDICLANRAALLAELDAYTRSARALARGHRRRRRRRARSRVRALARGAHRMAASSGAAGVANSAHEPSTPTAYRN